VTGENEILLEKVVLGSSSWWPVPVTVKLKIGRRRKKSLRGGRMKDITTSKRNF
jgi:hypothetical protein